MGKMFLFIFFIGNFFSSAYAQSILFPPPPTPIPPPQAEEEPEKAEEEINTEMQKRRDTRKQKNEQELDSKGQIITSEKKIEKALVEESKKPRNMEFMLGLSLILPKINTSSLRKKYSADPGISMHTLFRLSKEKPSSDSQMWLGMRLMNISGTGIYKNKPARFGFTYFGPELALGKIELVENAERDRSAVTIKTEEEESSPLVRKGRFVRCGLALQSRISVQDPSTAEDVKGEFDNNAMSFDSPGLWAELSYFTLYYGAIGLHYEVGVQAGKGKNYIWLALGTSGWF